MVQAQVLGPVDGGHLEGLHLGHAALVEHPELPVSAQALHLAVGAQAHDPSGVQDGLGPLGDQHVVEVVVARGHRPAPRAGIHHVPRHEVEQALVLPHVGALVPVVLTRQAAVAHHQGRCVARSALAEQLRHVVVDHRHGQRVLHPRMTVLHHRHVRVDQRSAFGHHHHPQLARRLDDHLARVPPALVVALHAERAHGLHALQVLLCALVVVHDRLEAAFGAVEDRAGREEPRTQLEAGPDHLGVGEHHLGVVRRIVRCGHAERQVGHEGPVGLRGDAAALAPHVRVHVDDARHDGLAGGVHHMGPFGHVDVARAAHCGDAVAFHDHGAVFDHSSVPTRALSQGDDARALERHHSRGHVGRVGEADLDARRLGIGRLGRGAFRECERLGQVSREVLGPQRPVERAAVSRPVQVEPGVLGHASHREPLVVG